MSKTSLLGSIAVFFVFIGSCSAVLVDGTCYLQNQTNHEGTKVLFQADSLGAVTDSAFTDELGYYQKDLSEGSYGVYFSHDGYVAAMILGQHFFSPSTLPNITLLEPPTGVNISGSMNGILDDTTYVITGNVTVIASDSLIVEPGAILYFIGDYDINIYGYFTALGTETDSIYFLSASDDLYWGSVIFRTGSSFQSALSYCHISGAGGSAINCYYVDITISHCTITENIANWGGGIYCSNANSVISECTITNNQCVNNGGGIYCTHCSPRIINCTILGNSCNMYGGGSGRGGGGICANHSSSPLIQGCTITGNNSNHNGGGISINDNSHAQIIECMISQNESDSSGGGIFCAASSNAVISDCEISQNTALNGGGFYSAHNDSLTIENCFIDGNNAYDFGGGICCADSSDIDIIKNTITANQAEHGGGIFCQYSNAAITNCTLVGNSGGDGAGIHCWDGSPSIINTIVEGSLGSGGVFFHTSLTNAAITYSDFYNNQGGNFTGNVPPGLGVTSTVNANGDSCDTFFNIFEDPLFVDPAGGDYNLQGESACIDAGDPAYPLDPDSTIADIGAFYFDQSAVPQVSISLTPYNPPITIPETGGSFDFNIEMTNNNGIPITLDVWIMVQLPNSIWFGPVLGPVGLTLPAGLSIERDRTQDIPGGAPAGFYTYQGRVGTYPDDIWHSDSFTFEKLGSTVGIPGEEWINIGEDFPNRQSEPNIEIPDVFALCAAYPNPFNPITNIRYDLPVAEHVKLVIYDVSGRDVITLVNGFRTPGRHEVTFDASGLSSGVYLYWLDAGIYNDYGKMVFLK